MLRTGQLAAAAALLQKQMGVHHRLQQPHGVARAALSLVVVGLASDDFDGAEVRVNRLTLTRTRARARTLTLTLTVTLTRPPTPASSLPA